MSKFKKGLISFFSCVFWIVAVALLVFLIRYISGVKEDHASADLMQTQQAKKTDKKLPEKNNTGSVPEIDTIAIVINRIILLNEVDEVNPELLTKFIKDNLGDNYSDTLESGSTLLISFDSERRINQDSAQFFGDKEKTVYANARVAPNFNYADKKYQHQVPKDGYTVSVFVGFSNTNEEAIANLIKSIVQKFTPRIYKRKDYFENKEKPTSRADNKLASKNPTLNDSQV